ncbi:hypothetical protein [Ruminococcus sp. 5_1_39BFAA]|uniref:hypothetical protein n=1 Tax=Ruminococcus sp. 5_1_39BFAA TaxID=457412 RepID=UPI0035637A45
MNSRFVELSSSVMGRRELKVALHEIYPDATQWNENGITYLEQYTRDNADSVKGMPLCAEFMDSDKDVPYGHGLTGTKGNLPIFEDSEQVGAFEDWSIEDVEIDGVMKRCLCAKGYINEARYPKFVAWLEKEIQKGNTVYGSVEFCGTEDNEGEIIYDGGWKEEGRVPMVYDYLGFAIISIRPADASAILIELNQAADFKDEFDVFESGFEKNSRNTINATEYDDCMQVGFEVNKSGDHVDFENIFD